MTPFDQARAVYRKERCRRTFEEDLHAHLVGGFVFSTPDFFVMGRPVVSVAPPIAITDPRVSFARSDCWHVFLLAGDIRKAWGIVPYDLPMMSFERKNELRFYPMTVIRRASARHL